MWKKSNPQNIKQKIMQNNFNSCTVYSIVWTRHTTFNSDYNEYTVRYHVFVQHTAAVATFGKISLNFLFNDNYLVKFI